MSLKIYKQLAYIGYIFILMQTDKKAEMTYFYVFNSTNKIFNVEYG